MKSKLNIRVLIALMSMALIGVVLIQFLWIRNAIHLKQEQFDRNVNMAMIRVSADLENKYGVHFITEQLEKDTTARQEVQKKAPGFYQFMISVDDEKQDASASEADTEEAVSLSNEEENKTTQINVNSKGKQITVSQSALKEPATPATDANWPNVQVKTNLIKIVNNVADAYEMSKMNPNDISDIIDSQKIYSAIRKEFARQGLPQDFRFATYCVQGDTLIINRSSSNDPLKDYAYKSPLLASDFIEAGTLLLINFPAHFRYIFASVAGMLGLSLLFTITIITAFIYSLMVIFRQKRLSDITNDFINNMTHELKTPLATISLTSDTLGLPAVNQNPEMVNEYSAMIKNEVRKLSRHVDRILEAAVLEKNGKPAIPEVISLNELIKEEVRVFEPQVAKDKGTLKVALTDSNINLRANRDLLRGVICNLLDNALKYSGEVPHIRVTLSKLGERALVSVEDKGIGISKADQKMVFEKFYRASTGNVHNVKGFGLGLSFVKTVIENLGGRVEVESELGRGSKFTVEIPVA